MNCERQQEQEEKRRKNMRAESLQRIKDCIADPQKMKSDTNVKLRSGSSMMRLAGRVFSQFQEQWQ